MTIDPRMAIESLLIAWALLILSSLSLWLVVRIWKEMGR